MPDHVFQPRGPRVMPSGIVHLIGDLVIGAAGAVTSFNAMGFVSITKESTAGQYTFVLADKYAKVLGADFRFIDTTAAGVYGQIISHTVTTAAPRVGNIVTQFFNFSDTAANAPSGMQCIIDFWLQHSQLGIGQDIS